MDLDKGFQLGEMRVEPTNGRLLREEGAVDLEPKVMALLCLLAQSPGQAVSRDEIFARLWPDVTVNDDALGRAVWKLRQALGDEARAPRFVATVPKKGYRLMVEPRPLPAVDPGPTFPDWRYTAAILTGLVLVVALVWAAMPGRSGPDGVDEDGQRLARADEFYYQFTATDNAAAQRLYRQAVQDNPRSAPALAGLANTLTQHVIRWSEGDWAELGLRSRIRTALANGRTQTPAAIAALTQARQYAEAAIIEDPAYALGHRALGLVQSAQGEIAAAIRSYDRAATLDPDAWEAFINLSDLYGHQDQPDLALAHMELAFEAMSRVYERQAVLVRPWYSDTGLSVAHSYRQRGDAITAERWYRRVLQWDPLNPIALTGLAAILSGRGDQAGVREVCAPIIDPATLQACLEAG